MTNKAIKGIGLGVAVGSATALIGSSFMNGTSKRKIKKNANKALRTMSDIVGNAQSMMR